MALILYRRQAQGGNLPGFRDTSRNLVAGGAQQLAQTGKEMAQGLRAAGQGAAVALQAGANVAIQAQREHNIAALQGAEAQLSETARTLLDDKDAGYFSKLGKNAMAEHENVLKSYENAARDLRGQLSNDTQREAFDQHWAAEKNAFADRVNRHQAREADRLADETFKADVAALTSEAISTASTDDHDHSRIALLKLGRAVDARGGALGWSSEMISQQKKALQTRAMMGVVDSFLEAGRDEDAAVYFDTARPDMDQTLVTAGNMEARIASANSRVGASRLADEAWEKGGGAAGALAWIEEQDVDPLVREGALRKVSNRRRDEEAARRAADSEPLAFLMAGLESGKRFADDDDRFQVLSPQGQAKALRERRRYDNRMGLNGPSPQQQQARLNKSFKLAFEEMDPREQLSMDPETIADQMGASVDAVLDVKLKQARMKGKLSGQALVQAGEFSDQLSVRIDQEHPDLSSAERSQMKKWVRAEYSRWRNTEGKEIPQTQDVADGWIGSWFTRGRKALKPDKIPDFIQSQPKRTRVQAAMKGEGFEPTGDEIPLAAPPKATGPRKVDVLDPNGKVVFRMLDNEDLAKWLAAHKGYTKQ